MSVRRVQFFGCMDVFSKPFHDKLHAMGLLSNASSAPAELGVVASFGKIIPGSVISSFPMGMLNFHPSVLPRYRGAAPAEWQILRGEKESGVTAILMSERVDAGDVIAQERFALSNNVTREELLQEAAKRGVLMLEHLLSSPESWKSALAKAERQNEALATKAPKVKREMGIVQWSEWNKDEWSRRMRAFEGRFGGLETNFNGKMLKVGGLKTIDVDANSNSAFANASANGSIVYMKQSKLVAAKVVDGWIGLTKFHFASRAPIDAEQFQLGYLGKVKGDLKFV